MQDQYAEPHDSDNDRTDELPVLTEEAIVLAGGRVPRELDDVVDARDDEDTGEHPVLYAVPDRRGDHVLSHDATAIAVLEETLAATRRELAASQASVTALTKRLEQRDRALAKLRSDADRQSHGAEELRASLKQYQQLHHSLQDQLTAAKEALAEQERLTAAAANDTRPYRDEIQALTTYIAGSRERWTEMETLVNSQAERIADLERELAQRIERQRGLEQTTHDSTEHARELKGKLADVMTTLRARERDVALLKRAKAGERAHAAKHDASAQQQALLAEREKQLKAANTERVELEGRLAEAEAALERLRADHARLENARVETERAASRQDERIAALQLELSERLAALRQLQASHAGSKTAVANSVAAAGNQPVLVCLTSDAREQHVIAAPEMTIGRAPECDIRILTHFVSREHARLKRENGKITIEDRGSRNGVFVNSVRIDRQELTHGDWVTIGETQFRFLHEPAG